MILSNRDIYSGWRTAVKFLKMYFYNDLSTMDNIEWQ